MDRLFALFLTASLTLSSFLFSGCFVSNYIDHVEFRPSSELDSVNLAIVFSDKVRLKFKNKWKVKDYGYIYTKKYSRDIPFEIGLVLKTEIVNDQEYVHFTPTDQLPNGVFIPVPHKLVEVRSPSPIDPQFDLIGYVDVLKTSWLGTAALLKSPEEQNFPDGLMLTQVFVRNEQGYPSFFVVLFGPSQDHQGKKRDGGFAFFANFRDLLAQQIINSHSTVILRPQEAPIVRKFQ